MKKSTKVLLITALCLMLSGVMMCASVIINAGFDFNRLGSVSARERVSTTDEVFSDVLVDAVEADVYLYMSSQDECRVECSETEEIYHQVYVENDTLIVRRFDNRKWYERINIGIHLQTESVKLYLPKRVYDKVQLLSTSGDVIVSDSIECANLETKSTSGEVRVYSAKASKGIIAETTSGQVTVDGVATDHLYTNTTSGDLYVSNVSSALTVEADTTSGALRVTDVECSGITAESVSGELTCSGVIAENSLSVKTVSGEIKILQSDAGYIHIESTSGSVRGTILTEKIFKAGSVSGSISCPSFTSGGICEVKTTSGDIRMEVVN